MADPTRPLLELRALRKSYGNAEVQTEILHGIDLRLMPGEFAALIGPSGSGKSTLLNCIGLLEGASSGELLIDGQATQGLDDTALTALRGRTLGFIFQFHYLLPAFSAQENVYLPVMADQGHATPAMRTRALDLLARVGLADAAQKRPAQLSGGQQQRVAIARALAQHPKLVLADEPTGNLDTRTADEIFALLREVNRSENTTFLIVTHDPRLAARCDRIIRLVDGQIVEDRANVPQAAEST